MKESPRDQHPAAPVDLPGRLASVVIARDRDDTVHAFHNVCAHRGNKVVWQEHPGRESSGTCRAFACKYHGWRYGLDGKVNHITNEGEFFDLDKSTLRMPPVHCEVWAGFIFVNFADDPVPLRSFLGDGLLGIEAYPIDKMTQHYRFSTRINGNWKLAVDSICEWYHPQGFADLEPFVADWALPTRAQRYEARLSRPYDDLVRFYHAIAPRAEEAIAYLNQRDINALSDDATRLLHLLYSMILVSYAVNVFKQNHIPDSGAAFFDMVAEPVP